ncbi:MAG: DUF192 domain-containing protein [Acidimicrobiia bacterium]|nr:DUF192 domain-containing protein [Acidimicrobiia bacterium]
MTRGARFGFDERREQRLLAWAILVVFVLGFLSFIAKGANGPPDPYLKPLATGDTAPGPGVTEPGATVPPSTVPVRTPLPGYGEIAFRVASGSKQCAILAETQQQQARGLQQRTDLGGYAGMLFVFPSDTTVTFWMRNTPLPLSIAWFDSTGRFVSQSDMVPCADRPDCPVYAAARAYRYALEVPRGGLTGLGVGPGAQIVVGGGC